mgnify:CR=1 FL=1
MMKYQSITILFVLLFLFRIAQSQCIETGYVKEYNGVEEKTPLPGVEPVSYTHLTLPTIA